MRIHALRSLTVVSLLISQIAILPACTQKDNGPASESSQSAKSAPSGEPRTVHLAIWSNYVTPETLADFEKKTGIKVEVANYSSNEELLAKLQAGASGYDVIVPSDYMIAVMAKSGLLLPLDPKQLPNFKNLNPKFLKKSFDPTNRFSVPYDWGTTGIAINRSLYKGEIKGWKDLFEKPDLAGKFTLLDDTRETIGAALKAQGFSLNSKNPDEIAKAKALLLKVRSKVKAFNSETLNILVNGEASACHAYSSDALQARQKTGGKIEFVIPAEGGTLWIDNLAIPQGASHLSEAHALINYLLDPNVSVKTVMALFVSPANQGVFSLLPPEYQANKMLFPADAQLAKSEMIQDLGETLTLWDRAWTEIKAQRD